MKKNLFKVTASAALVFLTGTMAMAAKGVSDNVVKIGVLTDMSGVYSTLGGKGTQVGVEMAVKDFGGTVLGKPIQVIGADHQNKADIASAKAREWFDNEKVDMITGLLNSGCALAVRASEGRAPRTAACLRRTGRRVRVMRDGGGAGERQDTAGPSSNTTPTNQSDPRPSPRSACGPS